LELNDAVKIISCRLTFSRVNVFKQFFSQPQSDSLETQGKYEIFFKAVKSGKITQKLKIHRFCHLETPGISYSYNYDFVGLVLSLKSLTERLIGKQLLKDAKTY
jgi:hypothetical protein